MAGAAFGLHTPLGRFYVDADIGAHAIVEHDLDDSDDDFMAQARAAFGWAFADRFSVFGGAQLSMILGDRDALYEPQLTIGSIDGDDVTARFAPGVFAGVAAF
jgi:hypothetical protein